MTTEGKHFKKQHLGASGGKTGESNPNTVFDPQAHRWVLAVGKDDVKSLPSHLKKRVKKIHEEKPNHKYAQRELKHGTGKMSYKNKPEDWGEKSLKLLTQERSLTGIDKRWNVFRNKDLDKVWKMSGKNKINGHEIELIIKQPKRGIDDPEKIFANGFVVDKVTGQIISNVQLDIDGKGTGLFEQGFAGCVRELQFNPKYRKYLDKYMATDLAGKEPAEAAQAVCGAILEEHGGAFKAERQVVAMLKVLFEKKFF